MEAEPSLENDPLNPSVKLDKGKNKYGSWYFWTGILLSLGCCVLALWGIQLSPISQAIKQINWSWLVLALAASMLTLFAKAARWCVLFKPGQTLAFSQSFSRLLAGIFLNIFIPARLGDLVRSFPDQESSEGSTAFALGTVVLEKGLDALFLLFTTLLLLTRLAMPQWLVSPSRDLALIFIVFVIGLGFIAWKRTWILKGITRLVSRLPVNWRDWVLRQGMDGLSSLEIIRYPRLLTPAFLWSLVIFVLGVVTNLFVFFSINLPTGIWPAMLLLLVLQIGVAVPSSPGRIGVFQYLTILTLGVFGISKELGLLVGVLLYLVVFLPIVLFGAWSVWRGWPRWNALFQRSWHNLHNHRKTDPTA